jgi:transcriptional regulator with XRE-family HTH domain
MEVSEEKIIAHIIEIRNKQRFTQEAIAQMLGITNATYSRMESGEITLSYKRLTEIASIFKMSVIDMITYPEVYTPKNNINTTKVLVELDVSNDEFIKLGLKDKVLQILNKDDG